ncbi:MAG: hypothetical protein IPH30_07440 [Betaproteobacteria bacterium]|nr:hypothetical protein [Betaproteobacteria bacterium]
MTTTLVALAVIMAAVIWWLVRPSIGARPWVEQRTLVPDPGAAGLPFPTVKLGLGVFIVVATSLFALSISAYLMRREGADWRPLAQPAVLWFSTAVLGLASVFFQRASGAAKSGPVARVRTQLFAGGACTFAFLAGQLWAWRQLESAGYYLTTNPANAFFYFLTALHAAHVLGGLFVWGKTTVRVLRGAGAPEVRMSVELCTLYWHFLLVVWIALFGLLSLT